MALALPGNFAAIGVVLFFYFALASLGHVRRELERRGKPVWWAYMLVSVPLLWPVVWTVWRRIDEPRADKKS